MSKASLRKGYRGVTEVAEQLRPLYPDVRARVNGEERQDTAPGRDLTGTPGLCVQVNLARTPRPMEKLREAVHAARGTRDVPVAWTRYCRPGATVAEPWLVTLHAADFVRLVEKANRYDRLAEEHGSPA